MLNALTLQRFSAFLPRSQVALGNALKLSFAGFLCIVLATACSSKGRVTRVPAGSPARAVASRHSGIDQIRLVALPVALNLDRRPGVDGFGVKIYGLTQSHAKPHEIRRGTIEILMYDGLLPSGTNAIEPLCTWSYTADELRQYELKSTIGLAYQIAPRWGDKKPAQKRITVMARYKPDNNTVIESAPSVITVPSQ